MTRERAPLADRLWRQVDRSGGPNACWPFLGNRTSKGYGTIQSAGRGSPVLLVHRLAYELEVGPIPDDPETGEPLTIDHLCLMKVCLNARRCMEPVTRVENSRRGNLARKRGGPGGFEAPGPGMPVPEGARTGPRVLQGAGHAR